MALGPLPDVENVLRVKLNGTNQGTSWVALFYWHYNGAAPTGAQLATFCGSFMTATTGSIGAALGTHVGLTNVEAWDLSSREGASASGGAATNGSLAGAPLPTNIAAVCGWKVSYRWRGGHPRTYWPAGVTSSVENGHLWTDVAVGAFQTANNSFLTAVNGLTLGGTGGYLTAVRYVHTPVKGQPPIYFTPPLDLQVQSALVDKRLDSQRRRLGPDL
jgi:hypothetical protein